MVRIQLKPILFKNYLNFPRILCYSSFKTFRPKRNELFVRPDNYEVDKDVLENLQSEKLKHRNHPGLVVLRPVRPPSKFEDALLKSSTDIAIKMLKKPAANLYNYLFHRALPFSQKYLRAKSNETRNKIVDDLIDQRREQKFGQTDEELAQFVESREYDIERLVRERMNKLSFHWREIDYGSLGKCLTYAFARFAPDYAILRRIFDEIRKRDVEFRPKNVFDFGSGVGSTLWAVEGTWKESVEEYYCVDTSSSMNDLLQLLIHNGDVSGPKICSANVYTRQYLPATSEPQYDVVVCAFSLMELPDYDERLRTIANLWEKTKKYLVFVENGNRYGYITVLEARDYILAGGREVWRQRMSHFLQEKNIDSSSVEPILSSKNLTELQKYQMLSEKFGKDVKIPTFLPEGFVYAPCPHDYRCPKLADVLPCKFEQEHFPLQLMSSEQTQQDVKREKFSYVVLKKGNREDDAAHAKWPRVIQNKIRKDHVRCDLCTSNGVLEEINVTRNRSGRHLLRLSKECQSGDLLPIRTNILVKLQETTSGQPTSTGDDDVTEDDENDLEIEEFNRK